jgi:hypothetical protein
MLVSAFALKRRGLQPAWAIGRSHSMKRLGRFGSAQTPLRPASAANDNPAYGEVEIGHRDPLQS